MPRHCSICAHPHRSVVDTALINGEAYRHIAGRFGTSTAALLRHKTDHLPSSLVQAKEAATVSEANDLLAKVAGIEAEAKRIAKKAEEAGDLRTAMSGIRELARLVELLAKLRGELNEQQTVNVILTPEWHRTRTIILDALAEYPPARVAVAAALRRLAA